KRTSEETMRRMMSYPWPGNIRELQNIIERAVVLSKGEILELASDFGPIGESPIFAAAKLSSNVVVAPEETASAARDNKVGSLVEMERRHIESVLAQTNWMIEGERGAAKILNLSPSTLRSRMQKLGIRRPKASI